ncbi:hypothetical protein [Modestobacter italicus]|uniref:hypothetical protein n=1 Tax=Modestobacter italicus (strain DSM 44449 / CECT 9708 / BC 501) TaxID=2732864 RepID=UPI001C94A0BB|nr:hypothetical protein [Modestobacter italicus]
MAARKGSPDGLRAARRGRGALAVQAAVTFLLVAAVWTVGQAVVRDGAIDWGLVVGTAAGTTGGALAGTALVRWWQRRVAGEAERERLRPFRTATRTGRLPAEADAEEWLPLLAFEQARHRRRMVLLAAGATALAVVLLGWVALATALGRLDVPVHRILTWSAVYVQSALLGWGLGARKQRRLAGMRQRLAARRPTTGPVR